MAVESLGNSLPPWTLDGPVRLKNPETKKKERNIRRAVNMSVGIKKGNTSPKMAYFCAIILDLQTGGSGAWVRHSTGHLCGVVSATVSVIATPVYHCCCNQLWPTHKLIYSRFLLHISSCYVYLVLGETFSAWLFFFWLLTVVQFSAGKALSHVTFLLFCCMASNPPTTLASQTIFVCLASRQLVGIQKTTPKKLENNLKQILINAGSTAGGYRQSKKRYQPRGHRGGVNRIATFGQDRDEYENEDIVSSPPDRNTV